MSKLFKDEQFVKSYYLLKGSKAINPLEKDIIEYILSLQAENKKCFISNQSLADMIGVSLATVKKHVRILNTFPFFKSEKTSRYNEHDKWINSKDMSIDEFALMQYLNDEKLSYTKKIKVQPVKKEEVTTPAPQVTVQPVAPAPVVEVEKSIETPMDSLFTSFDYLKDVPGVQSVTLKPATPKAKQETEYEKVRKALMYGGSGSKQIIIDYLHTQDADVCEEIQTSGMEVTPEAFRKVMEKNFPDLTRTELDELRKMLDYFIPAFVTPRFTAQAA